MSDGMQRCVVIGGGIAGMASAAWLAEAGHQVTLLERRGALGGRTHAIAVPQLDDIADNGQHVMVTGFHNLMRYLDSVGTREHMTFGAPIAVRTESGSMLIGAGWRGALAMAVGALPAVPRREWWATMRAQQRMMWQSLRQPHDLDAITVDEWFRRIRMPASARSAFFEGSAIGMLDEKTHLASAKALADLWANGIRSSVRNRASAMILGYSTVDYDTLFVRGAERLLAEGGHEIRYRAVVRRILTEDDAVRGVLLADGSTIDADMVICAVPAWNVSGLLDEVPEREPIYAAARQLDSAPIVSVNLYLDRAIGTKAWCEFLQGGEGVLEQVFDRQRMHARSTDRGFHYSLTTSAAYDHVTRTNQEIVDLQMDLIRRLYPEAAEAKVLHAHVVRMNKATFSQRPGSAGIRPTQATSVRGLVLAGDWTQTDWPSTMESAAQSAALAVETLLAQPMAVRDPRPVAVA